MVLRMNKCRDMWSAQTTFYPVAYKPMPVCFPDRNEPNIEGGRLGNGSYVSNSMCHRPLDVVWPLKVRAASLTWRKALVYTPKARPVDIPGNDFMRHQPVEDDQFHQSNLSFVAFRVAFFTPMYLKGVSHVSRYFKLYAF